MNSTATGYIIGLSGLTFTFQLAFAAGAIGTALAATFIVTTAAIAVAIAINNR